MSDRVGVEGEITAIGFHKSAALLIHIVSKVGKLIIEIYAALFGEDYAEVIFGDIDVLEVVLVEKLFLLDEAPKRVEASDRGLIGCGLS